MKQSQFACDMTVFDSSERKNHIEKIKSVFWSVKEIKEISNGYTFILADEKNMLENLTSFITGERLCCPFFGFVIEIEPQIEDIWLKITGQKGIKDFIKAEFGDYLCDNVSWNQEVTEKNL